MEKKQIYTTLVALKEALQLKESTKVSYKNYKNEKEEATLTGDIEDVHDFLLANDFDLKYIITRKSPPAGYANKLAYYTCEKNGHDYYIEVWYFSKSGKLQSAAFIEDHKHRRGLLIKSVDDFKENFVEWALDFKITDLFKY